jgi:hypothetical protein
MTAQAVPTVTPSPVGSEAPITVDQDVAPSLASRDADHQKALLGARLLAAAALLVSAFIHAKMAVHLGLGGPALARGHLFAAQAAISAILAAAMLSRNNRVWLVAAVLSAGGLGAILASVYFPLPAVGPLPAINEPAWLLNKAIAALAELSVISLWLIRQIAPPKSPHPELEHRSGVYEAALVVEPIGVTVVEPSAVSG